MLSKNDLLDMLLQFKSRSDETAKTSNRWRYGNQLIKCNFAGAKYSLTMLQRILLLAVSFAILPQVLAQPMMSYLLLPQSEISRGRLYMHIEEESEVIIKGVNSTPNKVVMNFNPQGLMVSNTILNSAGGKTNEIHWEYAHNNRFVRKFQRSFVNMRGWSEEETVVTWDKDFTLPTKIEVFKNGKNWQWAILMADSLNRVESARVISSAGAHVITERLIYIEASNMIKVMIYRANGLFVGTVSYPINHNKPFVIETVSRKYYPNGEIMIETLTDAVKGDQAYFYEYEYDNQSNWIVKNTYQVKLGKNNRISKKKLEHRITRKITYY